MSSFKSEYQEETYLFHEGTLLHSYLMLGAHFRECNGEKGVLFAVWAPHAVRVSVIGDFNQWDGSSDRMQLIEDSGIWEIFIPQIKNGEKYKYEIETPSGQKLIKADPYAFYSEMRPQTASIVHSLDRYQWHDQQWQQQDNSVYQQPMNIYEVHLGTWVQKEDGSFYNYRDLAQKLVPYCKEMGYTHIEVLPLNEHPFDRSWGYQVTGYYSVTSRYGRPEDFKFFVDYCHQHQLGVIMDWVPGHFCKDDQGLRQFDGTPLYEYEDRVMAEKHEWGTLSFDFGKNEVQSFLISNAVFWFDVYHIDGIRVDAVASMLYFNEEQAEKIGQESNKEAVQFIRNLNKAVFKYYPDALMIAEESSDWPLVSAPVHDGGLGFNYKWNMGWMNDMLDYMELDPIYRKWNHNLITFSFFYAFSENFILPLSHDEVVHGKKSLLNKMPGDDWQKFANLRVFLGYMMAHPGKKLLFMGGEFGQFDEWKDQEELDWHLLEYEMHAGIKEYMTDLNHFYLEQSALWQRDHDREGFAWIDANNNEQSLISFIRRGKDNKNLMLIICNFTPSYYEDYQVGVPEAEFYREVFNSDLAKYGGSGKKNKGKQQVIQDIFHGFSCHIKIKIPPLSIIMFEAGGVNKNK